MTNTPNTRRPTLNAPPSTPGAGFTIFELLAVITIIGVVLAVTLGSFTGWSDAHAVRGSANVVEAALGQAHDYAVAHRVPVSFSYETDSSSTNGVRRTAAFQLATASDGQPIGVELQRLSGNVWLTPENTVAASALNNYGGQYVFLPNGSVTNAVSSQTFRFFVVSRKMRDTSGTTPAIAYSITIDPATGTATAEWYKH
jgi:prepilin-type N-terminal cleavage/methylation domain-containing protein